MAPQPQPWPGPIAPAHPALLRKIREEREWLGCRENLMKYAGQVVGIAGSVVWGHGPDFTTAVALARKNLAESSQVDKPAPEDLSYLIVPDLITPEDPLPLC